jgi:cytoskeletal protein CcmA (bactofilin family)
MTVDAPPPRRRFSDAAGGPPTLLGDGGRLEGRLSIAGPLTVGGHIVADGEVGGLMTIGRTGRWQGHVRAHAAVVLGTFEGVLEVATTLELARSAVVRGTVRAALVAIAVGATVEGEIEVTGSTPIVHYTDRRGSVPDPGAQTAPDTGTRSPAVPD